ncbi:type 1 fimbrial protein [Salmonella enterica]|nr:type 1 fimbrial protein [Salmonella enterica]
MKIKNRLFLLGAAMAVMSSSAFADTNGTQTFTANVTADTCTIVNLNQTFDLGSVLKADIGDANSAKGKPPIMNYSLKATGCPASFKKMTAQLSFPGMTANYGVVPNTGTAKNASLFFLVGAGTTGTNLVGNNQLKPTSVVSTDLTGGAGELKLKGLLYDSGSSVSDGTLSYSGTITVDFV